METLNRSRITNVLITGGTGFLGSHLVQQFLELPDAPKVTSISRNPSKSSGTKQDPRVTYLAVDITNAEQLSSTFNQIQPQIVVHAASPLPTSSRSIINSTILPGVQNLLTCAQNCPSTQAFIYTSSFHAVIPNSTAETEDETHLFTNAHPAHFYRIAKAVADSLVRSTNSHVLRTCVLRLPTLYGPGDRRFFPSLIARIQTGKHTTQFGRNEKATEFLCVHKAAETHVLTARALLRVCQEDFQQESKDVEGEGTTRTRKQNGIIQISTPDRPDGLAFHITDGIPQPHYTFCRMAFAAAGHPVQQSRVTVIPLPLLQMLASLGEWAAWVFTANMHKPGLRRVEIDELDAGHVWNIDRARRILGYTPVKDQAGAVREAMDWALRFGTV